MEVANAALAFVNKMSPTSEVADLSGKVLKGESAVALIQEDLI